MIELRDVSLAFGPTAALDGVSMSVRAGAVAALTGPSGCGKSTLLHVSAGLLLPDTGTVRVDGFTVSGASDRKRTQWRLARCGFVFQLGELVPELSLADNIALPLEGLRKRRSAIRRAVADIMTSLEIAALADKLPSQVSGGEAQRAAIARALVHEPAVVFADEPTGSLDQATGAKVLELFVRAARDRRCTVILGTHERMLAEAADSEIRMVDGQIRAHLGRAR